MINPVSTRRLLLFTPIVAAALALAACSKSGHGPVDPANYDHPVKVACVGDSITAGPYPGQLQKVLGDKWEVKNYGVGGRTLLKKGDAPWWNEQAYKDAHAFNPDVVVIMLGTNDTKPQNFAHADDFYGDYKELIETFKALPSKPHIWIMRPCPVPDPGNYGINEKNLDVYLPQIDKLAAEENVGEIDIHAALEGKPELLPDHVHPNEAGSEIMAETVAHAIAAGK